jgi:hypothetical protein
MAGDKGPCAMAVAADGAGRGKEQAQADPSRTARQLGADRSVIDKQRTGRGNLTLRAVTNLAGALDRNMVFSLVSPESRPVTITVAPFPPGQES